MIQHSLQEPSPINSHTEDLLPASAGVEKSFRLSSFFRRRGYLLLAFFIPALLMFAVYAVWGVHPFGESSVLVLDLNGQYVYFFQALRDFVYGEGSLLYSFSRALGGEYLGIYAYYLASPLSYIVALFPEHMLLEALYTILVIKVGLCGLTMAIYLRVSRKIQKPLCVAFSILWALSAYAVVYQHNTMWIDCVALFPLLVLGLERIIDRRGCLLFILSLGCCLLFNFYIGYMCCLFCLLYFFVYYAASGNVPGERHHFGRALLRVGASSILGILLSCIIVLPTYVSLQFGKTEFSVPNFSFTSRFDILNFLSKLFVGSYDTVRPEGLPLLYCGIVVVLLAPLYFICRRVPLREKISYGLLALFLAFCMTCNTLDMVWHGFQQPNWLNYRYSFMLCFLLILFAAQAMQDLRQIGMRPLIVTAAALVLLLGIMQKMDFENLPDLSSVWLSTALILIYSLLLFAFSRPDIKHAAAIILCGVVSAEAFGAALLNLNSLHNDVVISSYASYHDFIDALQPIVDEVKSSDTSFYRMEKVMNRYTNEPLSLGYRGLSNSTSTLNTETIDFLFDMGYASKSHWSKYIGGTPVNDSLVGLKYIIDYSYEEHPLFEEYKSDANTVYTAFLNPYALSLCVAANEEIKNLNPDDYDSPFTYMNAMVSALLGREVELWVGLDFSDQTYTNAKYSTVVGHHAYDRVNSDSKVNVHFFYDIPHSGDYYVYLVTDYWREVSLRFDGYDLGSFFGNESWCISKPVYIEKTDRARMTMSFDCDNMYLKEDALYVYYLDEDLFKEVFAELAKGNYQIDSFSDTQFKGTIYAAEDGTVWTTIPYDTGWHVKIDGENVPIYKLCDALIGFDISAGEHTLELRYMPACFVVGSALSVFGLLLLLCCLFLRPKIRPRWDAWLAQRDSEAERRTAERMQKYEEEEEEERCANNSSAESKDAVPALTESECVSESDKPTEPKAEYRKNPNKSDACPSGIDKPISDQNQPH